MNLKNKVAVITGASQGIGKATALMLAQDGINLALIGRNKEKLQMVADECEDLGVKASVFSFDLTNVEKIPVLISDILKKFPAIDFLINNAGTYVDGNPFESDLKKWDYALDLNFRSVYHLTNQFLTFFNKDGGAIINVSSISGMQTSAGGEIYNSTKHALRAYSNCLFESVREKNIKVTCICPGFVNTEMSLKPNLNSEKMIQPEDIANSILWVLKIPNTACPTEITVRPQLTPYR
jgi:NADP-dependent 3-hydroxy acid dehydrogenase YdfG